MKRLTTIMTITLGLCAASAFAASSSRQTMPYAFDYHAYGAVTPLVTWNNGDQTFVELPGHISVTGAFIGDTAAKRFVGVRRQGPYWVVPAVARRTTLVTQLGKVSLSYTGPVPHPHLSADSKKLDGELNKLQAASQTLSTLLTQREARRARLENAVASAHPAPAERIRHMSPREAKAFATAPGKESASQGRGLPQGPIPRARAGMNRPVASGQGTLDQFAASVMPRGWTLKEHAPVKGGSQVAWEHSPNWKAALTSIAETNGWHLSCDPSAGSCTLNPVWHVYAGSTLRTVLSNWAQVVNWTLAWKPQWDRKIAGNAAYIGSFKHAVSKFVKTLHSEGVPVRAKFWGGNDTLEVKSTEPASMFGGSAHSAASNGGSND
ncbi:MAG TPA: TcpQ domain-containing protein [Gammaproteobacteria bacterium]|nr:TcpQ domain-containing protein [Gammaproteobacteria bacterium]